MGGDPSAAGGGLAGAGGAAIDCTPLECSMLPCAEPWLELDGCPSCACAPPPVSLTVNGVSCPSASLTLEATSSAFFGGLDRWLIDFEWTCSDLAMLGEPSRGHLQIGIIQPLPPPLDARNRMFSYPPLQSGREYELRGATIWVRGSGVPEIEQQPTPSSSFLSIRLEDGDLVGGVEFIASSAKMAGPFRVAVPTAR